MSETMTRGQILWNDLRQRRDKEPVSVERARLVTESFKETEGQPYYIRRAKAFDKVMTEFPIYIDDLQLLAGDYSTRPMAAEWFPEIVVEWVKKYMDMGMYENPEAGNYVFEAGKKDVILDVCDYWKTRAAKESFYAYLGEEKVKWLYERNEEGAWIYAASTEAQSFKGWNVPDVTRVLERGFIGLIADIDKALANLFVENEDTFRKKTFLQALRMTLVSGIKFANRYSVLAKELAEKTEDPQRKQELLTISEACAQVPEHPARTFQEALQSMFFCHLLTYFESRTNQMGYGRVDQYLYPYYKKDVESGLIDKEYATQLLECFRVKLMGRRNLWNWTQRKALTSEAHFHNCLLGGQTPDGRDAVNELSFLWLDAAERVRTPHPTLSVRWHPNLDMKFAMRAVEVVSKGMGFPAWFNDTPHIEYMLERGATLHEARDYSVGGCVLATITGKTGVTWPSVMNFGKILELAMHDGMDPRTQKQFGPHTGKFEDFKSYDEFVDAVKTQIMFFIRESVNFVQQAMIYRSQVLPDLFSSCLFDDCIEKGLSIQFGGAKYPFNNQYVIPVGVVDVANSLYAVQKVIFEEKSVGQKELMDALAANFEGYEAVQAKLLAVPKYGNDDDGVDYVVSGLYSWLCDEVQAMKSLMGGHYEVAPHSIAFHANMGRAVGATPDGRKAGVSLADGAVSPRQGTDTRGPAAVIRSAGKIDHTRIHGTLFNMKFMPSALKNDDGRLKLYNLIETFFGSYEGKHLQFNVVDKETLLDAKAHPENHRDLIVRVAGYSALWNELNSRVHDELIARTENDV